MEQAVVLGYSGREKEDDEDSHNYEMPSPAHFRAGHLLLAQPGRFDCIRVWLGFLNRRLQALRKLFG